MKVNKKKPSSDEVFGDLLDKIVNVEYMPGDSISENDLSVKYNVSRNIIRTAFARLRQLHLIDVYPQRGTFVSPIHMKMVNDIMYVRTALETLAITQAIRAGHKDELAAQMQANLDEQKQTMHPYYDEEMQRLDNDFHRLALRIVGREGAMDAIEKEYIHARRWRKFVQNTAWRMQSLQAEHEKLLACVEAEDFTGIAEALDDHLDCFVRMKKFGMVESEYLILDE